MFDDAVAIIVGVALTFNVIVCMLVHVPTNPVTVYTVVDKGFTDTVDPVNEPGFHV